jgi:hypothetical protein
LFYTGAGGHAHGSGGRGPDLANLPGLPARPQLSSTRATKIIPYIFRIMAVRAADRPLFRPDRSQVGMDCANAMRCRRALLLAGGCCCCCHRCRQPRAGGAGGRAWPICARGARTPSLPRPAVIRRAARSAAASPGTDSCVRSATRTRLLRAARSGWPTLTRPIRERPGCTGPLQLLRSSGTRCSAQMMGALPRPLLDIKTCARLSCILAVSIAYRNAAQLQFYPCIKRAS